ncbi:helix-turn-helix domain-containing protein [Rhodovulum kholense]|uniref:Helix-turn-helix protein n=1 Tax=Rhodovulum kholense TaxID=453584 RepID=A0A8E2VGJ7_9RHOB|nr:helix-turn-helix domain-containing protein [Rhodovulum kholense]PTW43928.1 helix-turn-helix protein [Rhodovulum kholense]
MMPSVCAAVALSINPSAAVWDQATQYDTVISLFPAMPPTSASAGGLVDLAQFRPSEARIWSSFERGSSGGFDLSTLIEVAEDSWSGVHLVRELRQLSGLTWQQAADLVGVKPRTLHNWATGQTIAEKNRRRLGEILAVLRHIDQGYAEANRDLLLNASVGGDTIFALMENGEFDKVISHVGRGIGRTRSREALSQRTIEKWGAEHFGEALSAAIDDGDGEITPSRPMGKRQAKAQRKG